MSNKKILLSLPVLFLACSCFAQLMACNLHCENRVNPLGIDIAAPQLNWQLISEKRNTI